MRYFLAGSLIVASVAVLAREQQVWLDVAVNGKSVGGFAPAPDKASMNQTGVGEDVTAAGVKTKDGASIRGFELRAWKEGERYRVLAFAIVSTDDRGSRVPGYGAGFKQVEFDAALVKLGEEWTISKMKDVGVNPWVLRAELKSR